MTSAGVLQATLDLLLERTAPVSMPQLVQALDEQPGEIAAAVYELIDEGLAIQTSEGISASWAALRGARPPL